MLERSKLHQRQRKREAPWLRGLAAVAGDCLERCRDRVTLQFGKGVNRRLAVLNGGIVLIAFLLSSAIGIGVGYSPARKAASLNPIDALRHE